METLPVREMVLYKHGVGFFRREGDINAAEVMLVFRHDEINDVLKSLAAFDSLGGKVLGIHYQTPLDKAARLDDSSIRLSDSSSLFDLLRDLRGREVTLLADSAEIRGRLVGIDVASGEEEGLADSLVSIASEREFVKVIRLQQIEGVRIHDERAGHDLHYFLDTSMSEELRRTVTVRLSPGSHHLVVYYVVPSPTWRVSYRLVAESKENQETGTALLQGWGLFDNRLDEDLEDVSVTLVAGQPISFIYDLYSSRIPERPMVEDETRVAPGPVEYRGAGLLKRIGRAPAPQAMQEGELLGDFVEPEIMLGDARAVPMRAAFAEAAYTDAVGHEAGEFFEYVVTTPVSVKRGDSALVPILNADLSYQKELLYNRAKLPDHPVAALRFENQTGLTLEHGPATVIEDGAYKGEAILAFTKDGGEVYLPYAVELGVRITEQVRRSQQMAGLEIDGETGYVIVEEYRVRHTTYAIENHTGQDKTVTIEAFIRSEHELFDTREPDAVTATERRWHVKAPAESITEFVHQERFLTSRHEELRRLNYQRLQQWMQDRWLDQDTFKKLSDVLTALGFIRNAREEQASLTAEREVIYQRQGQLRENLGALQSGGEEGQLRKRMLDQLSASETRLEAIEARIVELDREVEEAESRIEEMLAALPS